MEDELLLGDSFFPSNSSLSSTSLIMSVIVNNSISSGLSTSILEETPSQTSDESSYVPYKNRPETYLVPLIFLIIFVVGLVGNGLLIFIFMRHKSLRNVPNTFILCLSAGDIMVIVGTIPFISLIYTLESWPFGTFICKLSEFMRDLSIGVTSLSLMVLSIDRYLAIAMALKQLNLSIRSKKSAYITSGIVWILAILIAIPGGYNSHVIEIKPSNTTVIRVCYPFPLEWIDWYPKIMVMTKFVLLYVVPLIFISISYAMLARHLLMTKKRAKETGVPTPANYRNQLKSRAKVAKLVLVFVAIFVISFLPNHLFMLWFYYTYPRSMENYNGWWHFLKISGYVLSFANSCTNPCVLYLSSGRFRAYYRAYLCCLRPDRKSHHHAHLVLRYGNASRTSGSGGGGTGNDSGSGGGCERRHAERNHQHDRNGLLTATCTSGNNNHHKGYHRKVCSMMSNSKFSGSSCSNSMSGSYSRTNSHLSATLQTNTNVNHISDIAVTGTDVKVTQV